MARKKKLIIPEENVVKEDDFPVYLDGRILGETWKEFIENLCNPLLNKEEEARSLARQQKMMLAHMVVLRWGNIISINHEKKNSKGQNEKGATSRKNLYQASGEILYYLLRIVEEISIEYGFIEYVQSIKTEGLIFRRREDPFLRLHEKSVMNPVGVFECIFKNYKWGPLKLYEEYERDNHEEAKTKFREKFKDDTQKLRKFENPYESGVTKDFFDCVIELATSMPNSRFCQEFTEHLYSPLLESRDRLTDILNDPNSEKKDLSPEGKGKSSKQGRRSDRMKE